MHAQSRGAVSGGTEPLPAGMAAQSGDDDNFCPDGRLVLHRGRSGRADAVDGGLRHVWLQGLQEGHGAHHAVHQPSSAGGAGAAGAFVYGVLNRLLIPVGLHHILNSLVWFVFGSYTNPETGVTATGDLNRFFAGDPTAGVFMAGFYFIFMFGVPAIALAMYSAAKPENKSKVAGMMFSIAFTAFLTGITEPVEFTFMFLAPVLYAFHAIMTGIALAVANMFGILHGFGFSAGLIDYVLNYGLATKPILIIPIGLVFGIIYFIVFRWAIVHFDLPTPGRFENESDNEAIENANPDELAQSFINKLGGADNLTTISSCITRLRLNVKDIDKIDEAGLKALGAAGVIKKGNSVQVIVGTKAEAVADDMKKIAKK